MTAITRELVKSRIEGQRVMLIGGAGFIGHHLALELSALGTEVLIVDNLMVNSLVANVYDRGLDPIRRELYRAFLLDRFTRLRDSQVELRNADARIMIDLANLFEEFRPTKVVHLSAIASAVEARRQPGLSFDLQLVTLRNALELCRFSEDVNQLLLISSSTVYGDFEKPEVDESEGPRPRGIYANTKYMAERLVRTYRDQYDLGVTIVRPSALYGERCISRRVSQVFIENALSKQPLLLEGGGEATLDFTYIADLAEGLVRALALHRGREDSTTFNLTFGSARKISELASIISDVIPGTIVEERPRAVDKPVRGTLSIERAGSLLGFEPQWPLEKGYRHYCEWYVDQWKRAASRA